MSSSKPIINHATITSMISMLDWAYRMGVRDYCGIEDEGLARDFLTKTSKAGVFGFLTDDYTTDWKELSLRMLYKARSTNWGGAMSRFVDQIGGWGMNYLCVFYNMIQVFYNMGVRDAMDYPDFDTTRFNSTKRARIENGRIRQVKPQEYVDIMQLETFKLNRRDQEVFSTLDFRQARKIALKESYYETFRNAIGIIIHHKPM